MKFNVALLAILPLTLAAPVLEPKGPDTTNGLGGAVSGLTGDLGNSLGGLTGGKRGLIDLDDLKVPVHVPVNVEVKDNNILKRGLIDLDDLKVPVHVPVNVEVKDNKILK
ncbi:hypothetical protein ACLOAV_003793 [Pseudogymnoascus australis]